MKKHLILLLTAIVGLHGCTTDKEWNRGAAGAYIGSMFGSIVGDLVAGHRGSHVGALVGGTLGAAAGVASAKAEQNNGDRSHNQPSYDNQENGYDNSISYGYGNNYAYNPPADPSACLEVRHIEFADNNGNRLLEPCEQAYISIDIYNRSWQTVYDVSPIVYCDNRHIELSPPTTIASIASGKGIRYRCVVRAKKKLQPGITTFEIGFTQQGNTADFVRQFKIRTVR